MKAEIKAGESAAFVGVDAATQGCKGELRGQVTGAGLGKRLANTWRSRSYPADRRSLKPGGFIWSKAPTIVTAFAYGATIRAKSGGFLAVPLPAAGKHGDGRKRITPGGWERAHGQRLRFVYRRGRASLLVADNARLNTRGRAVARKGKGRARMTIPIFAPGRAGDAEEAARRRGRRAQVGRGDPRPGGRRLEDAGGESVMTGREWSRAPRPACARISRRRPLCRDRPRQVLTLLMLAKSAPSFAGSKPWLTVP